MCISRDIPRVCREFSPPSLPPSLSLALFWPKTILFDPTLLLCRISSPKDKRMRRSENPKIINDRCTRLSVLFVILDTTIEYSNRGLCVSSGPSTFDIDSREANSPSPDNTHTQKQRRPTLGLCWLRE